MNIQIYGSSNNPIGWFHFFIAYLIKACGVKREDSFKAALNESDIAYYAWINKAYGDLSDNQCVMCSNRWFYRTVEGGKVGTFRTDKAPVTFQFEPEAIDYWLQRI